MGQIRSAPIRITTSFLLGLNSPNKDPQQETVLCYEIGVGAAWFIERRRARDASETALTPT